MGQQVSIPGVVPAVGKELGWKTGKKADVIPNPLANVSNLDSLNTNSEFKDSLLMMFRSNYLISSLLSDGCSNDSSLLSGIQNYQTLDDEFLGKIMAQTQSFREINSSGIAVKLAEMLDVVEKDVAAKKALKCSPFLKVFQKRLIALQGLKDCIQHERVLALEKRKPREYSSQPGLNSDQFPQLLPLVALLDTGLSFFRLFPLLIHAEGLRGHTDQLVAPIASFQQELGAIQSLALFKTWSPKPFPPIRSLTLDKQSVHASVGTAADVFDKPSSGWNGNKSSCSWSVNVTSNEIISFITIQWASLGAPALMGAPKCVTISSRPLDLSKPAPPKSMAGFEVHGIIFPDMEFKKQNTWTQVYPVRVQGPATIHLLMSKVSSTNNCNNGVRIFSFTAGNENLAMKCSNPLPMLHSIQESLVPLGSFSSMEKLVCKSIVSLPYISGSLSLSLRLFDFIFIKQYEQKMKEHCKVEFVKLLRAVYDEEKGVLLSNTKTVSDKHRDDVSFDEKCKSSDCILTEGGMLASFTTSSAYVMTNCPMETGIWTWEISIIQDNSGDETACLGIARRPLATSSYDSNPNTWVIRCYNGELYHNGRLGTKSISVIHPKDVCRFTFDCQAQTLSLCVNESEYGVVFEDVPVGIFIFASFYSSNKSVRLLSVKHRDLNSETNSSTAVRKLPPEFEKQCPSEETLLMEESWSAVLLERISSLARARAAQIIAAKSSSLEYPHCIEVSIDVFESLVTLLTFVYQSMQTSTNSSSADSGNLGESDRIVVALLDLLDVHFSSLAVSKVDIAEVGFAYERKSVEISQKPTAEHLVTAASTEVVLEDYIFSPGKVISVIQSCHAILSQLRSCSNPSIRLAASTVLARGSILLFPNAVDKLKLIVSTFDSIAADVSPDVNKANIALLASLLSQIHDISEISLLLNQHKSGSIDAGLLVSVIDRLISVVSMEIFTASHAHENGFDFLSEEALRSALILSKEGNIRAESVKILLKFQQHVAYEYILCRPRYDNSFAIRVRQLFERYCDIVLTASASLCQMGLIAMVGTDHVEHLKIERCFEESHLMKIAFPLLHSFCFCMDDNETVRKLLPKTVHLYSVATSLVKESIYCGIAEANLKSCIIRKAPQAEGANDDKHSGWRRVKDAVFETGESSFTISEDGILYTSNHSSNTCALVSVDSVLKYNKLAWEFELASDSVNDQCSVFGASRKHPSSRCYSSSPDLWMRRAYNGYMYANGATTGSPMEKIQPGDVIRIEHDFKAGTIAFGVNGGAMAVGFHNVNEPVYPACGSYRTGVQIRLVKVETFGSAAPTKTPSESDVRNRNPEQSRWCLPSEASGADDSSRDQSLLTHPKAKGARAKDKDSKQEASKISWLTVRSDQGVSFGISEWSFELLECSKTPFALGVVFGGEPYPSDFLGGPCTEILEEQASQKTEAPETENLVQPATSTTSVAQNQSEIAITVSETAVPGVEGAVVVVNTAPFGATPSVASSVNVSAVVVPQAASNQAIPTDGVSSTNETKSKVVKANSKFSYRAEGVHALSWHSDGSLWIDGDKVASNFGKKFLPLEKLSAVSVRINRIENTITYYVNGESAGVAFGSTGTGASVIFELPSVGIADVAGENHPIYPAASISNISHSFRLRPTGLLGPTVLPFPYLMQKACSSVVGRLSAVLLSGPALDKKEAQVLLWLQSPLLIGGMDHTADSIVGEEEGKKLFLQRVGATQYDKPAFIEGRLMAEWYDSFNPEPLLLKKNLESKGSYRFLQCELPFLAALMKHGGLVLEAFSAISSVIAKVTLDAGESVQTIDLDNEAVTSKMVTELSQHSPSADMLALWTRVRQLRFQLRKERQSFITKSPENAVTDSSLASTPEPVPTVTGTPIRSNPFLQELVDADSSMFHVANTAWCLQPADMISRFNASYYCTVLAIGFDFSSQHLLVRFHVVGDNSLGQLQGPRQSRLTLGPDRVLQSEDDFFVRESPTEYLGVLSYSVGHTELVASAENVSWQFGRSGYGSVHVQLPVPASIGNNRLLVPTTSVSPALPSSEVPAVNSAAANAEMSTAVETTTAGAAIEAAVTTALPPADPAAGYLQLLIDGDGNMFRTETTAWRLQPSGTISRYNTSYFCTILAVGYSFDDRMILVRFRVCGDGSLGPLQSPLESQLIVEDDGEAGQECDAEVTYFAREDENAEYIGTIRFEADYEILTSDVPAGRLFFRFGSDGYSRTPIYLPDRDATGNNTTFAAALAHHTEESASRGRDIEDDLKIVPKSFEEYCKIIEDRSRFLLRFRPSNDLLDTDSEEAIRSKSTLNKVLENSFPGSSISSSSRISRFRSEDGEKRWKQVIEFLRVHSKLKKQHSNDSARSITTPSYLDPSSNRAASSSSLPIDEQILRIESSSALDDIEEEEDDDAYSISAAQASMQAGALFICGDAMPVSTESLEAILERRNERAKCRIVAFQSLCNMISLPTAIEDYFSVEELLLFVRAAMQSNVNIKAGHVGAASVSSIQSLLGKSRIHYLTNLEGCSVEVSSGAQEAFLGFYARITQLLARYIENWEVAFSTPGQPINLVVSPSCQSPYSDPKHLLKESAEHGHLCLNSIRMMLNLWCIHFSNRDHRFLFHCGLLPTLYRLISLSTYEHAVQSWSVAATQLTDFVSSHASYIPSKMIPWKGWSDAYVEQGLKSGTIPCRSVLMHLSVMPDSFMSKELKTQSGLGPSFQTLVSDMGIAETSFLFHRVSSVLRAHREKAEQAKDKEIEVLEASKLTISEKINEICASCGKFDATFCGSGITLTSHSTQAGVTPGPNDHDPLCVMANVHFSISHGLAESGNYFEVEILVVGRGDIGVGFCNRAVLPVKGRMPGWDPSGSYAYHGDDGKKYGPGATFGDWALWANGDVIGCGIDPARRVIFYTRNGILLGDGFTGVTDIGLWPVVGFANQNRTPEKVAINFGAKPFVYTGPEVVYMPKALRERIAAKESLDEIERLTNAVAKLSACPLVNLDDVPASASATAESTDARLSVSEFSDRLKSYQAKCDAASAFLHELVMLRSLASAVLVFLLVVTRSSEDESSSASQTLQPNGESKPMALSGATGFVGNSAISPSPPVKLARGVSAFGTPKLATSADGRSLQEAIYSALIQEIVVGSDYLLNLHSSFSHLSYGKRSNALCLPPARSQKTISELQKSKLEHDVISGMSSGSKASSTGTSIGAVVEAAEVESMIFDHLNTLQALLPTSSLLAEELSGCQVLRSLFNLLLVGSPRVVRLIYKILSLCLPMVTPEDAERAISSSWRDCLEARNVEMEGSGTVASSAASSQSRRKRKIPSTILKLLLTEIQQTLTIQFSNHIGPQYSSFGHGDELMLVADHSICLLQQLFETPSWTEVVSCTLTDSFRDALGVLENVDLLTVDGNSPAVLSTDQVQILLSTCACLSVFSGFNSLRSGARVKCLEGPSTGAEGYLVSANESEQTAKVIFVTKPAIESLDKVETVPLNSIQVISETVRVDLSRLSQPLLPQLVGLIKVSLQIGRRLHSTVQSCEDSDMTLSQSIFLMLSAHCATALSSLMEASADQLMDCLIDTDLIGDIVNLSLLPSGLASFVDLDTVSKMWLFSQCRQIECRTLREQNVSDVTAETSGLSSASTPAAGLAAVLSSVGADPVSLPEEENAIVAAVDLASSLDRSQQITSLSSELGLPRDYCRRRLEYFMYDVDAARASLSSEAGFSDDEFESAEPDGSTTATSMPVDGKDGHLLQNIENSEGKEEAITFFPNADMMFRFHMESMKGDVSGSEGDVKPQILDFIADGDGDGKTNKTGGRIGVCFVPSLPSEEMLVGFQDRQLGITMFEALGAGACKRVTAFYNSSAYRLQPLIDKLSFAIAVLRVRDIAAKMLIEGSLNLENDADKLSDWLLLMKLVSATSTNSRNGYSIDSNKLSAMCSAILSRAANAKLALISSTIKLDDMVPVIEADNSSFGPTSASMTVEAISAGSCKLGTDDLGPKPLSTLDSVTATLSPNDLQNKLAKLMAKDLSDEVSALADSRKLHVSYDKDGRFKPLWAARSLSTESTSALRSNSSSSLRHGEGSFKITNSEPIYFSTPHPFTSPCCCSGEVLIPSSWRGTVVTFHPKCHTPSGDAKLSFYATQKDMDSNNPICSYSGAGYNFTSLSFPSGTESFLYKFTSGAHGNRPALASISKAASNAKELKGTGVKLSYAESPLGLGEEDSLAALFGMGETETVPAAEFAADSWSHLLQEFDRNIWICEMDGVQSGSWYFEVDVLVNDVSSDIRTSLLTAMPPEATTDQEAFVDGRITAQLDINRIGLVPASFDVSCNGFGGLGSAPDTVGLSASGVVHLCSPVDSLEEMRLEESFNGWAAGDVISVLMLVEPAACRVCFAKNGVWGGPIDIKAPSSSNGAWKPAFEVSGLMHLEPNYGGKEFRHFPSENLSTLLGVPLPATEAEPVREPPILPLIDRPLDESKLALSWGFCFKVQELNDFGISVARTFELIWSKEAEDKTDKEHHCTIWRPKPYKDFLSVGDVIVPTKLPPQGALLVNKKHCLPAKTFKKVFSTDSKLFIWRPIPPPGYVALGDWATTSSTAPSLDSCMCVPAWAVVDCGLDKRVYVTRKAVSTGGKDKNCVAGIWGTLAGLGTFIANPSDGLHSIAGNKVETEVEINRRAYTLKDNHGIISIIAGEWVGEDVVCNHGSLSWCNSLFRNVLDNSLTRSHVVTTSMFGALVNYLKSSLAPNPFKAVSMLVQFIRSAYNPNYAVVHLPISQLDGICKAVLAKAIGKKDKGGLLSDQLFALVDLVVEVIIVQLPDGSDGAGEGVPSTTSKSITDVAAGVTSASDEGLAARPPRAIELRRETSEQLEDNDEVLPAAPPAVGRRRSRSSSVSVFSNVANSANWWQHRTLQSSLVDTNRTMSLKKIEPIFSKDPPLRKLKYAIKFFTALESLRHSKTKRVLFPKRMICKLWYDYASSCVCDESQHPYKDATTYGRRVFIPGAEKLVVTFDKRCSLGDGAVLVLKYEDTTLTFNSSSKSWSSLTIPSDCVEISFTVKIPAVEKKRTDGPSSTFKDTKSPVSSASVEATAEAVTTSVGENSSTAIETSSVINMETAGENSEWGWAFIIHAVGPIFESALTHCSAAVEPAWLNSELAAGDQDNSSIIHTARSDVSSLLLDSAREMVSDGYGTVTARSEERDSFGGSSARSLLAPLPSEHVVPLLSQSMDSLESAPMVVSGGYGDVVGDSLFPRPVSRAHNRGDYSGRRTESSVDSRDVAAAAGIFKVVGGEFDENNAELVLPLIAQRGLEIQSGTVSIPHSTEIDITILPKLAKQKSIGVIHVMKFTCSSPDGRKLE
jgi:hypothetical protein